MAGTTARISRSLLGDECPVTRAILLTCLLIYGFIWLEQGGVLLLGGSSVIAREWGALTVVPGTIQPWRYLSASFVHYGLLHVGLNCMMLASFGRSIEGLVRGHRTAVVFLGGSVAGFFASDVYYGLIGQPANTAGASAGIASLIGAYIGVLFALGNAAWKRALGSLVVYSVVFAFIMPGQINHVAHVGGLAAGWGAGVAFVRERRKPRNAAFRAAAWALAAATLASIAAARLT